MGPGSGAAATMATFIGAAGAGSTGSRSTNVRWSATTAPSTTTSMLTGYSPGRRRTRASAVTGSVAVGTSTVTVVS